MCRVHIAHVEPTFNRLEEKPTSGIEEGVVNYRCDRDGEQENEDPQICVEFKRPGTDATVYYVNVVGEPTDGVVYHFRWRRLGRWPNGQCNHATEHEIGKQMEYPTEDCDGEADYSNAERRARRGAQDGEHAGWRLC